MPSNERSSSSANRSPASARSRLDDNFQSGFVYFYPKHREELHKELMMKNISDRPPSFLSGAFFRKKRRLCWSFKGKAKVRRRLKSMGLRSTVIERLLRCYISELQRIEETCQCLIDCLWLFDKDTFDGPNYWTRRLVRKVLSVGADSLATVCKQWKVFTSSIFLRISDSLQRMEIQRGNMFGFLLTLPKLENLLDQPDLTKQDLEDLSMLISNRMLPTSDRRAGREALKKLKENTTSSFIPSPDVLVALSNAARHLGEFCRERGGGPLRAAHLSLACAGSLDYSVNEGGRAKEILEGIKPVLCFKPEQDEEIHLPWTTLKCPGGQFRWCHWCRETPYPYQDGNEWGSLYEPEGWTNPQEVFEDYHGIDDAVGEQVLACAFLELQEFNLEYGEDSPIPVRTLVVPEPGFKSRCVTTGPWWLYVLEQPLAHVSRAFLGSHPSLQAGMMRTDQAWQYLYQMKDKKLSSDQYVMSSDLKEATDRMPHWTTRTAMTAFFHGIGYDIYLSRLVVGLISRPRKVDCRELDDEWVTSRGIFMGEPMAKTVLTIVNQCAEELAIRDHLSIGFGRSVRCDWRAFACAGDDHIATGPLPYLLRISENLEAFGLVISREKTNISKKLVRYCEKLLEVPKISEFNCNPGAINDSHESYLASPFVDSIKTRLMSPVGKTTLIFNDRNGAIGKAITIGRTMKWLNTKHFPLQRVKAIRDRFLQRMGTLIPSSKSGVYWHLLLPQALGGLELWTEADLENICVRLPLASKILIRKLLAGSLDPKILKNVQKMNSNSTFRGFELPETDEPARMADKLIESIVGMGGSVLSEKEALEMNVPEFENHSRATNLSILRSLGWLTKEEIVERLKKTVLMKNIFACKAKQKAFNTEPLKARYSRFWEAIVPEGAEDFNLTVEELKASFECLRPEGQLYQTNLFGLDLLREVQQGSPTMAIKISTLKSDEPFVLGEYV